jgi:hypothetical protein
MKYIVMNRTGKYADGGTEVIEEIFIFSPEINHDEMLEGIRGIRFHAGPSGRWERSYLSSAEGNCISAGFITGKGICSGESESIGIKSRPVEDTLLAQKSLGLA